MTFFYLLRRTALFFWHAIVILFSYIQFLIKQIRILFLKRYDMNQKINKLEKIPKTVALVIDNYSSKYNRNLLKTVDFITGIPQVDYLAVYFNQETAPLSFESEKVQVLTAKENEAAFLGSMGSKKDLSECYYPFPKRMDLAIIFSKYPQLCNFFTWTLDLTILYFAGPSIDISPVTIYDAFNSYSKSEQRCGK